MTIPAPSPSTTCLITGASAGIGEQLARSLARRGHNLTLVARHEARLMALAEELARTTGVEALAVPCDLGAADARRELVARVRSTERDVSVLVNSAGLGGGASADPDAEFDLRNVRVGTEAVVDLCGIYGSLMVHRGGGAILNIAPLAGVAPGPGQATSAATRAFVVDYSHALRGELARAGVTVTVLRPGSAHGECAERALSPARGVAGKLARLTNARPDAVAEAGLRALARGQRQRTVGAVNKVNWMTASLAPRALELAKMYRR
jgi:short-subunit dehydrogenase